MKQCNKCGLEKNESEFSKKTGNQLQAHCKKCHSLYVRSHYLKNKETYKQRANITNKLYSERNQAFVNQYKRERGCLICSEAEPAALDFHHLIAEDKESAVSSMIYSGLSVKTLLKEINKCVVLCANCHRKLHAGLLLLPEKVVAQEEFESSTTNF